VHFDNYPCDIPLHMERMKYGNALEVVRQLADIDASIDLAMRQIRILDESGYPLQFGIWKLAYTHGAGYQCGVSIPAYHYRTRAMWTCASRKYCMVLELRRHNARYILLSGGAQNSPDGLRRIGILPESFKSPE
jgi:hypothetical protein